VECVDGTSMVEKMELVKSFLGYSADPVIHVLAFVLLLMVLKSVRRWWMIGIVYLFVMAIPLTYQLLSTQWSVPDRLNRDGVYDYMLLLTGVSDYKWHKKYMPSNRMGYCNFNQNGDRIGYVLQEMKSGKISNVLLGKNMAGGFDETSCIVDFLVQQGISLDRIITLGHVGSTLDELNALNSFLDNLSDGRDVVMVTSSYHMRRAVAFSSKLKLDIDHFSVNKPIIRFSFSSVIPESKWLEKSRVLLYEIIAYFGYKIFGYL